MDQERKNNNEIAQNNIEAISFFAKDHDFVLAFKKTEKLATAVYMVTGLLSDSEPMKWTLRRKVSELLTYVLNYKDIRESNRSDFVYNLKTLVLEKVSMLETLSLSGYISQMNFSILKQEFLNLVDIVSSTSNGSRDLSNKIFPETFFDVQKTENLSLREVSQNGVYGHLHTTYNTAGMGINSEIKDSQNPKEKDVLKRSNRQNIIIGLLRKKKELTIKDIAQTIKDCSEKTIQRELISLISLGLLKRTGERRWSKYSLVPEKLAS